MVVVSCSINPWAQRVGTLHLGSPELQWGDDWWRSWMRCTAWSMVNSGSRPCWSSVGVQDIRYGQSCDSVTLTSSHPFLDTPIPLLYNRLPPWSTVARIKCCVDYDSTFQPLQLCVNIRPASSSSSSLQSRTNAPMCSAPTRCFRNLLQNIPFLESV